jgi:3-oxoacyl-[acyl-carrier protein] reductase
MQLGLTGCRALVTGASRGLGRACAHALAGDGAQVVICSRGEEALAATASEIGAAGWIAADVSRREDVRRAVAEATATLGGLDILVTNAGGPPTGSFEQARDEDWAAAHQLTLMSSVRLIREAVAPLKASGRGRIVNLTGFGVKEPMTDLLVSDSARAAVTVMAKTIATDFAPFGITVNNIAPGPILTDRLFEWQSARAKNAGITVDEQLERFAQTIPVRRVGQPDEVGKLCAYLCSAHAGFITGQSIVIDGGVNRSI